jgi:predicted Zn-dependent protease
MKKNLLLTLVFAFLLLPVCPGAAQNPIVKYFSKLLDESRAEMAVGKLLQDQFIAELNSDLKIELDENLTGRIRKLAENTPRPEMQYNVYVIDSDIADEIVFPGGGVFLTSGLLQTVAADEIQLDFILSRNLMHLVLRHPMKLLKKEGLYAGLLNQTKLQPEKRDAVKIKEMIRDYLRNQAKMDHQKVDLQGILMLSSPEKARKSAIDLLKKFTGKLWPVSPMDTGNLPARIEALEKLKLPE